MIKRNIKLKLFIANLIITAVIAGTYALITYVLNLPYQEFYPYIALMIFIIAETILLNIEIHKPLSKIIEDIMVREGLTFRDFVFRDIPELCAEGKERSIYVDVKDLKISVLEKNELGPGSKTRIEFTLPPGAFATIFVEQLFR